MRCMTLADVLRQAGAEVSFICRELPGNLCGLIEAAGFALARLPQPANAFKPVVNSDIPHAAWLEVDWRVDAEEAGQILARKYAETDWLIVDHYALDAQWEGAMRRYVKNVMVIDDIADRKHDCDLLLDQNMYANFGSRYDGLVPLHCRKLLGPDFVLLRKEFCEARGKLQKRDGNARRILVFFGGADSTGETEKALRAIELLGRPDIALDVVVGASNPHKDRIKALCAERPNAVFHYQTHDIANLILNADLALGAGGASTWERMALQLPALTVSVAGNQNEILESAANAGVLVNLGDGSKVGPEMMAGELLNMIQDAGKLSSMAENAFGIVDGFGAERVSQAIIPRPLRISLVSDHDSWINEHTPLLMQALQKDGHVVNQTHTVEEIPSGDLAFFLSLGQLVPARILARNRHNLVVHASALPAGKGWSPWSWQILEGKNEIPVTLLEAGVSVDSGDIYRTDVMRFTGLELIDELRQALAAKTVELCAAFVSDYPEVLSKAKKQQGPSSYYPRRKPQDSKLDIDKSIRSQFNLLRIADNERYPAFFELDGQIFTLKIQREDI